MNGNEDETAKAQPTKRNAFSGLFKRGENSMTARLAQCADLLKACSRPREYAHHITIDGMEKLRRALYFIAKNTHTQHLGA